MRRLDPDGRGDVPERCQPCGLRLDDALAAQKSFLDDRAPLAGKARELLDRWLDYFRRRTNARSTN